MDFNDRIQKLQQLVAASGGIVDGSKKLQKLAYICQAGGDSLGQNFMFHHYGVYSASLAADVQAAGCMNMLDLRDGLGSVVTRLPDGGTKLVVPKGRGFQLVNKLKHEEARLLEVLTTILYLMDNGYTGRALAEKLYALKGQHQQFFAKASEIAREEFHITVPDLSQSPV